MFNDGRQRSLVIAELERRGGEVSRRDFQRITNGAYEHKECQARARNNLLRDGIVEVVVRLTAKGRKRGA